MFEFALNSPAPPRPEQKAFNKKFPHIEKLNDYRVAPDDSFFDNWKKVELPSKPATRINVVELEKIANELGYKNTKLLNTVISDLTVGAPLMTKGVGRSLTECSNAPSAYDNGERTTDAVLNWQSKGFIAGPFKESPFPEVKVSGIMAVEKPDGSIRPVVNLSAPKGASVNDGISKEEMDKIWPLIMASTPGFARAIMQAGWNAEIWKADQVRRPIHYI